MIKLKYAQPVIQRTAPDENPNPVMFSLHPQGKPAMTAITSDRMTAMVRELQSRLVPPVTIIYNPHRIGISANVSVQLEDYRGKRIDILLTQNGHAGLPLNHEFNCQRWYINVPDSSDLIFLTLWLTSVFPS